MDIKKTKIITFNITLILLAIIVVVSNNNNSTSTSHTPNNPRIATNFSKVIHISYIKDGSFNLTHIL